MLPHELEIRPMTLALTFEDDDCNKSFSKDGKDGKDDVSGMGGIYYCQDFHLATW